MPLKTITLPNTSKMLRQRNRKYLRVRLRYLKLMVRLKQKLMLKSSPLKMSKLAIEKVLTRKLT